MVCGAWTDVSPSAGLMLHHSLGQSLMEWSSTNQCCQFCWQLVLCKYFKWTAGWSVRFKYFSGTCSLTGFQFCLVVHTHTHTHLLKSRCRCSQLCSRPITSYYAKPQLSTRISLLRPERARAIYTLGKAAQKLAVAPCSLSSCVYKGESAVGICLLKPNGIHSCLSGLWVLRHGATDPILQACHDHSHGADGCTI